ncbi:MAG: D-alanine--D-alanine ligase [Candidatus Omnitrophota bacterium]|nr:MAG: D-alanine--D-alanine ligase [Candidatus Omnitrophota bacterium]
MEKMSLANIRVGVLGGGVSSEREISLLSAQGALNALKTREINTVFIDIPTREEKEIKEILSAYGVDIAFVAMHGEFGEDGGIQKILEDLGISYTGSGPEASFLAMDKIASKKTFIEKGIPTASFCVLRKGEKLSIDISYPVVVKPHFAGSSIGISIVKQKEDLAQALDKAFTLQDAVILEDYIAGRELTVGVLEERPLAVVEIIPRQGYYDFNAKYSDSATQFIAPAQLPCETYCKVQELGLAAHKALGCRHFARVDIRLRADNIPYVLEVNSIPGLTSHSLLPLSAKASGIDFGELIAKMTTLALNGKK